jgi:hypothetical protein
MDSLVLEKKYKILPGAVNLHMESFDITKTSVGILDSVKISSPVPVTRIGKHNNIKPYKSQLSVTSKNGNLYFDIPDKGSYKISLFSIQGKRLALFNADAPCSRMVAAPGNASKLSIVRIEHAANKESKTIILN